MNPDGSKSNCDCLAGANAPAEDRQARLDLTRIKSNKKQAISQSADRITTDQSQPLGVTNCASVYFASPAPYHRTP
ncbi:MAG: hypothetical protein RLZZ413_2107 [Pseudomonadota bacterium]